MNQNSPKPRPVASQDSALGSEASFGCEPDNVCPNCQACQTDPHRPRSVPVDGKDRQLHRIFEKITEDGIHRISGRLGSEWKPLARELGIANEKIEGFAEKENFRERAHAMLIAFMQKEGKGATKGRVAQALKHKTVDRKDIADEYLLQGEEDHEQKPLELMYEMGSYTDKYNVKHTFCRTKDGRECFLLKPVNASCMHDFEKACKNMTAPNHGTEHDFEQAEEKINTEDDLLGKEHHGILQNLKEEIDEIALTQSKHEYSHDHIVTTDDVDECSKLVQQLQQILIQLRDLSKEVLRSPEDFLMKSKTYEQYIKLAAVQKELQERVAWLKQRATFRAVEQEENARNLAITLNVFQTLGKDIEKYETSYQSLLQECTVPKRTQSDPVRKRSVVPDSATWRPNSSFEPGIAESGLPPPKNEPKEQKEDANLE